MLCKPPRLADAPRRVLFVSLLSTCCILASGQGGAGQEAGLKQNASPQNALDGAQSPVIDPAQWLANARHTLMNTRSLSATIQQQGYLESGACRSEGTYQSGAFPHVRLDMTTKIGPLTARLLEVCDGQVLWRVREISGLPVDPQKEAESSASDVPPGTELYVARRDIDLISDALITSPQSAAHILAAELGVGGIPALLAGLEASFNFRTSPDAGGRVKLIGRWKPEVLEQLGLNVDASRVPTEIEVTINPLSPVPEQIAYFRPLNDNPRQAYLITRFSNITSGDRPAADTFQYVPPVGVDVTNLTSEAILSVEAVGKQ